MAKTKYEKKIIQTRLQITVRELYEMLTSRAEDEPKQLRMNPAYQRDYIASSNRLWQQNLIKNIVKGESVIPYLYIRTKPGFKLGKYTQYNGQLMNPGDDEKLKAVRLEIVKALSEIIDGQQRSLTVVDFINLKFILPELVLTEKVPPESFDDIKDDDVKLSGLNLDQVKDIKPDIYESFMDYEFTIVATQGSEGAIHQMFCDLNDLNKMSNQEKRNAKISEIAKYIRDVARLGNDYDSHQMFNHDNGKGDYLNFPFKRMNQDEVLAKVVSIIDGSAFKNGLNKTSLDKLYEHDSYKQAIESKIQKKIKKVLDKVFMMLKNKEAYKTMNVGTFLNLVMAANELIDNPHVKPQNWSRIWDWFLKTHTELGVVTPEQKEAGYNETLYHQKTRLGQDVDGLDIRLVLLKENGLYENEGVQLVDRKRVITDNEKLWMWIKADKKCTVPITDEEDKVIGICETKIALGDAIKAHIIARDNGGKTTIENTYVACPSCNRVKVKNEPNWRVDLKK